MHNRFYKYLRRRGRKYNKRGSTNSRGANENLNGLIRQFFPKKHHFSQMTEQQILEVQNILNKKPRKRFNFKSPIFVIEELLFN